MGEVDCRLHRDARQKKKRTIEEEWIQKWKKKKEKRKSSTPTRDQNSFWFYTFIKLLSMRIEIRRHARRRSLTFPFGMRKRTRCIVRLSKWGGRSHVRIDSIMVCSHSHCATTKMQWKYIASFLVNDERWYRNVHALSAREKEQSWNALRRLMTAIPTGDHRFSESSSPKNVNPFNDNKDW